MAVMQLGTMAAVLVYFRKDLWGIRDGRSARSDDRRSSAGCGRLVRAEPPGFAMVIGTIPVVLVGFFLDDLIEGRLTKSTTVIIGSLVGLAALALARGKGRPACPEVAEMTWKDALMVGIAQAFALIPGSSRSGTTITAGLFLGFTRAAAARFSFLLSVPAVLASGLYQLYKVVGMVQSGADVFHLGMAESGDRHGGVGSGRATRRSPGCCDT